MAKTTTMRLRAWWFSIHKWIGILLALLIIPLSLTGSALVWHDWLDETINPQRYEVSGEASQSPSAYAAAAQAALAPGDRIATIRYPEHGGGPVIVSATRPSEGRPKRTTVWLDPGSGSVLDRASADAGLVRIFHNLHGSLMVPGWGRTIVGWVGVFMFISCLTGIWLWWPITGSVRRGFRWKRQNSTNANLHHQMGFWIALPLAILSFTGFWISFPSVFSAFEASPPGGKAKTGSLPDRARALRARPLAETALTPEAALVAAQPHATGPLVSIVWPTDQAPEWKIAYGREGGPAEVEVTDATGAVKAPRPPRPETNARLMRRLHDGTGMGPVWQTIVFIGGIIPALLAITGLVMWWRSRGWKAALRKKRSAREQPAG